VSFEFREARRENVPLLIGLAGGTGSGKTNSTMLLAKGLANGKPFYGIDTENGRMLHYADDFDFRHGELHAPFRPERYADAIEAAIADASEPRPVVVVDSFSHEHAGEGGLLDWHEEELDRMAGADWQKRERVKMAAWIKPKMAHKAMVNRLLQLPAHIIVCLRAEPKVEIVKNAQGKTEIVPKQSLVGLDGWIPIAEKNLPFELTASFLLMGDRPGVPKPIKLPEQFKPFFPLDSPITEAAGRALGEWASGASVEARAPSPDVPSPQMLKKLNVLVGQLREGGHIKTEQLWQAMDLDPQLGLGEDGEIHWSPLRDHLSKQQASALIERLSKLDAKVAATA
jgi:hypothetical protein